MLLDLPEERLDYTVENRIPSGALTGPLCKNSGSLEDIEPQTRLSRN